jgi:hypothetical protein
MDLVHAAHKNIIMWLGASANIIYNRLFKTCMSPAPALPTLMKNLFASQETFGALHAWTTTGRVRGRPPWTVRMGRNRLACRACIETISRRKPGPLDTERSERSNAATVHLHAARTPSCMNSVCMCGAPPLLAGP